MDDITPQVYNRHSTTDVYDARSVCIESDSNTEAIAAKQPDLKPMRMVWNNEVQAYDCIPIRE